MQAMGLRGDGSATALNSLLRYRVKRNNMNIRGGAAAICVALLIAVPGSAQSQETGIQPDSNADTTRLIESIAGPALFKAYCATCHGSDGKGNGPMTEWLKVKPPDLTHIDMRAGGFPLARVQRIISGEENMKAGHGTREMPVWGPIFSQVAWDQDLGRVRVYNLSKFIEKMQQKR
jgi:mono/diheme cytochrome c family protein